MSQLLIPLFLLSLALRASRSCERNNSTDRDIHILALFPCNSISIHNCDGIDRIPIMKLALEEINERCDLLPGYRLVVDYANSAVSATATTELDMNHTYKVPRKYHVINNEAGKQSVDCRLCHLAYGAKLH